MSKVIIASRKDCSCAPTVSSSGEPATTIGVLQPLHGGRIRTAQAIMVLYHHAEVLTLERRGA